MVKVLMVHGFGVNAKIFENQTAPVRALLPSDWEYYYLQGPFECGPAPGIAELYPEEKYNCWFFVPSLNEFKSVHGFLEEIIEEEGPFDVAWGFSAGAMILGSLILHYAHARPEEPQPFRSAVFMNCSMPWSATKDLGVDVTPLVIQHEYVPSTIDDANRVLAIERERNPTIEDMFSDDRKANWQSGELIPPMIRRAYEDIHQQDLDNNVQRKYEEYEAHRMFYEKDSVRVPMPTAHILGEIDPLKDLGNSMIQLCDEKTRLVHEHKFGHEVPRRSPRDIKKIAEIIEKTVRRSDFL